MRKKKESPIVNIIMGIGLIALGIKALFWVTTDFSRGFASTKWPTTAGIVLNQSMTKEFAKARYQPHIQYEYTVNGRRYINDTITYPTKRGSGKKWAENILDNYKPGLPTSVYYNPKNPEISCLEPGANYFFLIIFSLFTPIFLGIGIFLLKQLIPFSRIKSHAIQK